jgi:uncharacterized membrane protein YbhN (UPF0104 family)
MRKTLLKIVITVGVLLYIFHRVNYKEVTDSLKDLDIFLLSVSLLILVIQILVSTFRWYLMLEMKGIKFTFYDALRLTWLGLFFNQVLPTGIGGDVIRVYQLNKKCEDLPASISSVFWDRLTGLFGLGLLILLGMPIALYMGHVNLALIGLGIIFVLIILFLFVLYFDRIDFIKIFNFSVSLEHLSNDGRLFCLTKKNSIKIITLSVIIQSVSVFSVYLIGVSIGEYIDILALLIIVPTSIITMALPISIAGWGIREGVMVFGLALLGVNLETSLLISIIYGVQLMLVSLPGGVYWIFSKSNKT